MIRWLSGYCLCKPYAEGARGVQIPFPLQCYFHSIRYYRCAACIAWSHLHFFSTSFGSIHFCFILPSTVRRVLLVHVVVERCTWGTHLQGSWGAESLLQSLDVVLGCHLKTQPLGSWGRRLPPQSLGRILGKDKKK